MKINDRIKLDSRLLWNSIFYGMKGVDNAINQKSGSGHDSPIDQHVTVDGVMNDLLHQEETQRVKETRDEYYRILNEADKYRVQLTMSVDENGELSGDIKAVAKKKTSSDFSKHCDVYNDENLKIVVIQDNRHIEKDSVDAIAMFSIEKGVDIWDYHTLLNVDWGSITPRFSINKFATKIVVRELNNTESLVDLYFPTIPGQFTKLDAIFISELNRIFKDKDYRSDIKDVRGFSFITDKAWNCDSLCQFTFNDAEFKNIVVYDGHFVLTYKCHVVDNGTSVTEKYRMKEVDEKYENNATKGDIVDVFALDRNIKETKIGEFKDKTK